MLQRRRVILKGGVSVGLAGMAGVARLGEQAKIGQAEFPDQRSAGGDIDRPGTPRRVPQRQREQ